MLRGSDFTLKCIEVFVAYLNIIERSNQLRVLLEAINLECYWKLVESC